MGRGRLLTTTQQIAHPEPKETEKRALLQEAAGLLGGLYVEVTRAAVDSCDPAHLLRLADQIARTGMAASRRIRKAAQSFISEKAHSSNTKEM